MVKYLRSPSLLGALCAGLTAAAWGQPAVPPPSGAPPAMEAPRDSYSEARREYWRNLSPEQREAIRRLSQEERQALIHRGQPRPGEAPLPAGRLSREERRQLRAQIREEHERRSPRGGGGRRP